MFNFKKIQSNTFKISIGLFLSVLIYYINNFFFVMGETEKNNHNLSVWGSKIFFLKNKIIFLLKINDKKIKKYFNNIFTFFCFYSNFLFASEIFNFDVKEVEIKENGNKFIGKKGGVAKSVDGTIIKQKILITIKIKIY